MPKIAVRLSGAAAYTVALFPYAIQCKDTKMQEQR